MSLVRITLGMNTQNCPAPYEAFLKCPTLVKIHILTTARLQCVLRVPQFRSQLHLMTQRSADDDVRSLKSVSCVIIDPKADVLQFIFLLPAHSNLPLFCWCTSIGRGDAFDVIFSSNDFDTAKSARDFLCNFLINVQRNVSQCFCCSCRGDVLHRAKRPEQLATICAERACGDQRLARRGQRSVGFTKKDACARDKMHCVLP